MNLLTRIENDEGLRLAWQLDNIGISGLASKSAKTRITNFSIHELCNQISKNSQTFLLRDVSKLMHGLSIMYSQQVTYIMRDVCNIQLQMNLARFFHILPQTKAPTEEGGESRKPKKITFLSDDQSFDIQMDLTLSLTAVSFDSLPFEVKGIEQDASTRFISSPAAQLYHDISKSFEFEDDFALDLGYQLENKIEEDMNMDTLLPDIVYPQGHEPQVESTMSGLFRSTLRDSASSSVLKKEPKKRRLIVDENCVLNNATKRFKNENLKPVTTKILNKEFFRHPYSLNPLTSYCYRCVFGNVEVANYFDRSDYRELQSTLMRSIEDASVEQEVGRNLIPSQASIGDYYGDAAMLFEDPENLQPNYMQEDHDILLPELGLRTESQEEKETDAFPVTGFDLEPRESEGVKMAVIPAEIHGQLREFYQFLIMRGLKYGAISVYDEVEQGLQNKVKCVVMLHQLLPRSTDLTTEAERPPTRSIVAASFSSILELASKSIVSLTEVHNQNLQLTVSVETKLQSS